MHHQKKLAKLVSRHAFIMYDGKPADTLNCVFTIIILNSWKYYYINREYWSSETSAHRKSSSLPQFESPFTSYVEKADRWWFNPKQWGWKLDGKVLSPIMTDINAAPENLLKFVQCKCILSSKNPCGTSMCSCRKHGIKCVTACEGCQGENCEEILEVEEGNFEEGNFNL